MARLNINDATCNRNATGDMPMTFTISLDSPAAEAVTGEYSASEFPAFMGDGPTFGRKGVDFEPTSGAFIIPPGQTSTTFDVTIHGTTEPGPQKAFLVGLSHTSIPCHKPNGGGVADWKRV